jgi:hypothetical protein
VTGAREIDAPNRIGRGGRMLPNETWPKGRRCKTCRCFLSIYNPGTRCWIHQNLPEPERLTAPTLTPLDRIASASISFGLADQVGLAA